MTQIEGRVERIEAQLQGIRGSQERVDAGMSELQQRQSQQARQMQADLDALRLELKAVQADRERLRAEISQDLAGKMTKLISDHTPKPAPRQAGYEHVVKQGQTLSEIATAYGVTVNAIVNANNMKSADVLKVGQKLFIPE